MSAVIITYHAHNTYHERRNMGRSYSIEEPDCFGDDAEYSETSSSCRACVFSADCADKIKRSVNQVAIRDARVVTPRKYYTNTTTSSTSTSSTRKTTGNSLMKPVKFNHSKPLAAQYITYVGYDVAEAVATRAVDLIQSCRNEYERELHATESSSADGDS